MNRPMYDKRGWILGSCSVCTHLNYVEPHGVTARCAKCRKDTEHWSISWEYRDISGTRLVRKPPTNRSVTK